MTVTDTPTRLLRASARRSYDPDVDIDWSAAPDDELWWMQPERTFSLRHRAVGRPHPRAAA